MKPQGRKQNARGERAEPKREGVRIQKVLAAAGIGSRRACEALIEEGRVMVNDAVVRRLPVMIRPGVDRVSVDGEPLERYMPRSVRQAFAEHRDPRRTPMVYVMLYKPRATLTTMEDPEQRRTVAELVRHPSGIRLYPVGRLDYDTLGLILLTNDGELANQLTHPRFGVHKTYRAVTKGQLSQEQIDRLRSGTYLADRKAGKTTGASRTGGVDLTIVKNESSRTILDITLTEGRNRQVRRMLAKVGCPVRKLVRIAMGPVMLKGVKPGGWRDLTPREVRDLRLAASGKGPAGPDDRALERSHAMKLGRDRSGRPGVRSDPIVDETEESESSLPARPAAGRPAPSRPAAGRPAPSRPAATRGLVQKVAAAPERRPRSERDSRSKSAGGAASGPGRAVKKPMKSGPGSSRSKPSAKGPISKPARGAVQPPRKPESRFPLADVPPRLRT